MDQYAKHLLCQASSIPVLKALLQNLPCVFERKTYVKYTSHEFPWLKTPNKPVPQCWFRYQFHHKLHKHWHKMIQYLPSLAWHKLALEGEAEQQPAMAVAKVGLTVQDNDNADDLEMQAADTITDGSHVHDSDHGDDHHDILEEGNSHDMDGGDVENDQKMPAASNQIRTSNDSTPNLSIDTIAYIDTHEPNIVSASAGNAKDKMIREEAEHSGPPSVVYESMDILPSYPKAVKYEYDV